MASSAAAQEFVAKVQAVDPSLAGSSPEEQKKIESEFEGVKALVGDFKALNAKLTPIAYLNNVAPTIADINLYAELHPTVSKLDAPAYYSTPSVTRYFDQIQHLKPVSDARALLPNSPFTLVEFDLNNMPPLERKLEMEKKKAKKAPKEGDAAAAPAAAAEGKKEKKGEKKAEVAKEGEAAAAAPEGAKKEKKEKKDKPKKEKPAPAPATGPLPSMIDLRVGKVLEVSKHPDAESLYVEKIDLAEETGPRTVCSGLVAYMKPEDIQDQLVIVVCNLKPVTMRGVKSFAMLLCATSKDGKEAGIEFVKPPPGSKAGDRVYFEGEKYENVTPEAQLNPKKKVFETIQPGFCTLDTLEAAWVDPETKSVHKIRTAGGVCKVDNFAGASLS